MRGTRLGLLSLLVLLAGACSITRIKWRIKWDRRIEAGHASYLERAKPTPAATRKPNVIILLADDLGKYDVSAYGGEHMQTPHIDQIAAEGVLFEEGYTTSPTCAPSRAGLMTGRVQNRYGFETQIMDFYPTNWVEYLSGKWFTNTGHFVLTARPSFPSEWQSYRQGVPPGELTMAELLKAQGYATAAIGKWHLGVSHQQRPLQRGFDYHYGFYGAFTLYTPERHWSGVINHEQHSFSTQHQWNMGRAESAMILEMDKEVREEQYLTFAFRDRAIRYIEQHQHEPFFLYVAFNAPHEPFQAPVDYFCRYAHVKDPNKRVYYAMISALDDAIGAIHQKVKALGLEQDTLIYLLSDNGGASYTEATTNGPLKGGKLTQFEGGINVPFMLKWTGKVPAGVRYKYPVSTTDVFVTNAKAAGARLPSDREYDGKNLLPFVTGQRGDRPHPRLFWRADHVWALRDGDYKLILSTRDGWAELHDLSKDKAEKINLKTQMPELFDKLKQEHQDWQKAKLRSRPLWPRIMDMKFLIDGHEYLFPA
jgi:arylsulfatase A-like enzyme